MKKLINVAGVRFSAATSASDAVAAAVEAVAPKRVKKAPVDKTKRDLVLISSESAKVAFLTTNILYSGKTAEQLVTLAKRDLAKKAKLVTMLAAEDLKGEVLVSGADAEGVEVLKANKHAELLAAGWTMGSTSPKLPQAEAPAAAAGEPAAEQAPAETAETTEEAPQA